MSSYIICSIGLTAAGKTTLLRKISEYCGIEFISEGAIKREMVSGEYSINNSTDEHLRSKGYKKAISIAFDHIQNGSDSIIIDASFHQQFRRDWIYDETLSRKINDICVIWVYCVCENEEIINTRIHNRFIAPVKCADNQANTIGVYNYTKSTFDEVRITSFNSSVPTYLITFDSEHNKIKSYESNTSSDVFDLCINKWRELWENFM